MQQENKSPYKKNDFFHLLSFVICFKSKYISVRLKETRGKIVIVIIRCFPINAKQLNFACTIGNNSLNEENYDMHLKFAIGENIYLYRYIRDSHH